MTMRLFNIQRHRSKLLIDTYTHLKLLSSESYRFQHIKVNHRVTADPRLINGLQEGSFKPRTHPGIMKLKKCLLPSRLDETIQLLSQKYPEEQLKKAAQKLYNYLWSRHLPPSDAMVQAKAAQLEKELMKTKPLSSGEQEQIAAGELSSELIKKLRRLVYHWEPVKYEVFQCFQYMTGRMSYDYSCLYRVLNEIKKRSPEFTPRTMLDFGSGLATSVWAANMVWDGSLQEHYCVDISTEMNTLAQLLLQDGDEDKPMCYKQIYFRHFLPHSSKNKYDLIISAFSLMELPSESERLNTLLSLWKKTEAFLVIIETGTNAGFTVINEARKLILEFSETGGKNLEGHVFAPCPHDLPCPREAANDGTPCNFPVTFKPFYKDFQHHGKSAKEAGIQSTFSYLIMKKGKRNLDEPRWSRIVREVHRHSKKVPLNTCSACGQLEHTVITRRRHGGELYSCARNSSWGDLLPAISKPTTEDDLGGDDSE